MGSHIRFARVTTIVIGIIALLLCAVAGFNFHQFTRVPWKTQVPFYFPSLAALDKAGRSYVSDTATRRVVAMNKDGTLRWKLEGGKRADGFYYAHGLAVDSQDRLYIFNWVPLPGADYKAQEIQIQRYRLDGSLEKTVFRLENSRGADDFPVYFSFFIQGDALYTILGDGSTIHYGRMSLDGEGVSVIRTLPSVADFVALAGTTEGRLVGAGRDGTLWEADPKGTWKAISVPGTRKPWDVKFQADGRLLILDLLDGGILRRNGDGTTTRILSSAQTGGVFADYMAVSPDGALAVADKDLHRLFVSEKPGQFRAYQGAMLSRSAMTSGWLYWSCLALAVILVIATGFGISIFFADRRTPLLLIQLVVFLPIIILVQAVAFNRVSDALALRYRDQVRHTLMNSANLVAKLIPVGDVQSLNAPADLGSMAYKRLRDAAKALQKTGQEASAFSYIAIYRQIGGQPYYVYTGSGTFGVYYPYTLLPESAKRLFNEPGKAYVEYSDDYGMYDASFSSLEDSAGKSVGVVEVGLFADLVKDLDNAYLASAKRSAIGSGALFIIIFVIVTLLLLRSFNALRKMTREIAAGHLDQARSTTHRDEVGQLSRDFEMMSGKLQGYLNDITALTVASARFVPRDFIDLLEVEDLTQLRLGDQTSRKMTVLFSSFLNFRKITGQMSPQTLVRFLNSYLGFIVPAVQANHGLIDKYMGDTYMALFPGMPDDALSAWKAIHQRARVMSDHRRRRGSEGLDISFGFHFGPLMMGIVGEQERLEGTVIGDSVNLASRLNGISRIYRVPCTVSHASIEAMAGGQMEEWKGRNPFRKLDFVTVKGKTEPLLVCQPLNPDDPDDEELLSHLGEYEAAFADWEGGRVAEASRSFTELQAVLPGDDVVRRHAERCRKLLEDGIPDDWSPAIKVTEK